MSAERRYVGSLRQAQVEQTRDRILESAAALVGEIGLTELTIPAVAERAQVSAQTVYRHFATVGELVDSFATWMAQKGGLEEALKSALAPEQIPDFIRRCYVLFDQHEAMLRAYLAARLVGRARDDRSQRNRFIERSIAPLVRGLPPKQARRASGALRLLMSIASWQALRDSWKVDGKEAGEMAAWAAEALIRDLERRRRR